MYSFLTATLTFSDLTQHSYIILTLSATGHSLLFLLLTPYSLLLHYSHCMPGAPTGGGAPDQRPNMPPTLSQKVPTVAAHERVSPRAHAQWGQGWWPNAPRRGARVRGSTTHLTRPKIPKGQGRPPHKAAPVSCQYPLPNQGSGTARRGTTVADGGVGRGERNMSSARVRPVEPWRAPTLAGCHRRGHVT